ncbi:MAG: hypothetical protein HKN68_12990 [Saprospiraceae bacterium]|nr:hypothetical protein [Saprospiraceae bacterium]
MNKTIITSIGFILFIMGVIAIVLSLVGLQLSILAPLENLGGGLAFLLKIVITLVGVIIVYVANTETEQ